MVMFDSFIFPDLACFIIVFYICDLPHCELYTFTTTISSKGQVRLSLSLSQFATSVPMQHSSNSSQLTIPDPSVSIWS